MKDIDKAKNLLKNKATCVLVKDDVEIVSEQTGIKSMMIFIKEGKDLNGFSVADKIVGKAVAMLFKKAGIKEVYAEVISKSGLQYLQDSNIMTTYKILTDKIINRSGTGICPMEETVSNIEDCEQGYVALKEKLGLL